MDNLDQNLPNALASWLEKSSQVSLHAVCAAMRYDSQTLDIVSVDESSKAAQAALYRKHKALYDGLNASDTEKSRRPIGWTWTHLLRHRICRRLLADLVGVLLKGNGMSIKRSVMPLTAGAAFTPMSVEFNGYARTVLIMPFLAEHGMEQGYIEVNAEFSDALDGHLWLIVILDFLRGQYVLIDAAQEKVALEQHGEGGQARYVLSQNAKEARPVSFLVNEVKSSCIPLEETKEEPRRVEPQTTVTPSPQPQEPPVPVSPPPPSPASAPLPSSATEQGGGEEDLLSLESSSADYGDVECDFV